MVRDEGTECLSGLLGPLSHPWVVGAEDVFGHAGADAIKDVEVVTGAGELRTRDGRALLLLLCLLQDHERPV
jgi:hypothetical protein